MACDLRMDMLGMNADCFDLDRDPEEERKLLAMEAQKVDQKSLLEAKVQGRQCSPPWEPAWTGGCPGCSEQQECRSPRSDQQSCNEDVA